MMAPHGPMIHSGHRYPVPLSAQYDPVNRSYRRTTGFTMPEALLPTFRAAIEQL